ncbi:hypothetical protein GCM10023346_07620 [Arthrobacter gyeryongensis]|uniref:Uncharacterized protein n=1 Tax=Arthrobacter gyeryongensis TaxID=1650592 RepID=A0ABP9S520_9MICC
MLTRQKISAGATALGLILVGIQPQAVFAKDHEDPAQPDLPAAGVSLATGTRPTKPSPQSPTTVIGPADEAAASAQSQQGSALAKIYLDANGHPATLPKELQHPKNLGPNGEPKGESAESTSTLPQVTAASMSKGSMTVPASRPVRLLCALGPAAVLYAHPCPDTPRFGR